LKIVTWNCNGAFRNKFERISNLKADIYIIQECENPEESKNAKYQEWSNNYLWIGDTKNKGLGIFARQDIEIKKLDWTNKYRDHSVKHFLPCEINQSFNILGVWTHKNNSQYFDHIGQFWKYLQVNKDRFTDIILVGDFNSSAIWHHHDKWWNHSDVVNELIELGIESFYHKLSGELQGNESIPTLYFQKNIAKQYHIDYFFGSQKFSEKLININVGSAKDWLELSDHMPILCEIEI